MLDMATVLSAHHKVLGQKRLQIKESPGNLSLVVSAIFADGFRLLIAGIGRAGKPELVGNTVHRVAKETLTVLQMFTSWN